MIFYAGCVAGMISGGYFDNFVYVYPWQWEGCLHLEAA